MMNCRSKTTTTVVWVWSNVGAWPHLGVERVVLRALGGQQDVCEAILFLHHNVTVTVGALRLTDTEPEAFIKRRAFLQTPLTHNARSSCSGALRTGHPTGCDGLHQQQVS